MNFQNLCNELETIIQTAYTDGTTIDEAERLAGRFLHAQMLVSKELLAADLDARMRKTSVKAIRSAFYMEEATKGDRKPSDTYIENFINKNELVQGEQDALDGAEVHEANLERYYNIFINAYHYFNARAKGRFE
jgi:hypothetical protein